MLESNSIRLTYRKRRIALSTFTGRILSYQKVWCVVTWVGVMVVYSFVSTQQKAMAYLSITLSTTITQWRPKLNRYRNHWKCTM